MTNRPDHIDVDPTPEERIEAARGAESLADALQAAGARTLGEYFAMLDRKGDGTA